MINIQAFRSIIEINVCTYTF